MSEKKVIALTLNLDEAWLLNSRVRDNAADAFYPATDNPDIEIYMLDPQPVFCPRQVALAIIRALADLREGMDETSILVNEEGLWYLERRLRHTDPEPEAIALLLRVHDAIMQLHAEEDLLDGIPLSGVIANEHDISYKDACKNAGKDTGDQPSDPTGTGAVPTEPDLSTTEGRRGTEDNPEPPVEV